jgi:uncharacterized protein YutE (UPF0331/DUF86 family)
MSPVDAALVRRKLARIAASLDALGPLAQLTLSEYRARLYERKAAERLLHEGIEAALDVNAHLIAEMGAEVPDDYCVGFVVLGDLGVLLRELAHSLAPSAGLRKRLVHEYESLDDAKVKASIDALLGQYPSYVLAVESYLIRTGGQPR